MKRRNKGLTNSKHFVWERLRYEGPGIWGRRREAQPGDKAREKAGRVVCREGLVSPLISSLTYIESETVQTSVHLKQLFACQHQSCPLYLLTLHLYCHW